MPVLLLCGCFLLLWHHTLLQCLPRWLPADDQCPQRGTASLSCRFCWQHSFGKAKLFRRPSRKWLNDIHIYIFMTCYFYSFYHRAKRQAAGGNRVPLTRGSPSNRGGVCPGLWGVQECPHLLNYKTLTENQFVYCDFCLWLKPTCEARLLHGQVSWTLDQVSALRQESSESSGLLLCCWHQYQGSAKDPGWGSFGYRVAWMKKNNRI